MLGLSQNYRYPLVLALVAAGILAVGLALKPEPPKTTPRKSADVTATRAELESLQRLIQRNSLRNMGAQFSTVADDVSPYLLPFADSRRNGIVWTGNDALVPKAMGDLPQTLPIVSEGRTVQAPPDQWTPGVPVALARTVVARSILAPPESIPQQGAWLVAVSVRSGHAPVFRPGIYNGTSAADCGPFIAQKVVTTIALSPELLGGGIFDLQGDLVGVIAECEEGLAVIAPDQVRSALHDAAASALLSAYGIVLTTADATWKQLLGADATAIVTDVWQNWPADVAGLQPGDSILSVDGKPVAGVPELVSLLNTQVDRHAIDVRRGGRRLRLTLQPISANATPLLAVEIATPNDGVILQQVVPGSSAARAGLRAGDRILELNGTRATLSSVLNNIGPLQVSKPVLAVVRRGARTTGVLLR